MTKRQECGILYMSAANRRWPTIALLEMTGFYDTASPQEAAAITIALLEMTGFYDRLTCACEMPIYYSPAGNDRVL